MKITPLVCIFAASLASCARSEDAAPPAASAATKAAQIDAGSMAPDFALPDQNNKIHRLSESRGKTVILAFYPADMTGGCTLGAHSLTQSLNDFETRNTEVYGISVQDVASKKKFCELEGITYPLLADVEKKVAADYGVLNGGVANRVTFLIAPDGTIAAVDRNVNVATHAQDLLKLIADNKEKLTPKTTAKAPGKVALGKHVARFALPNYDGKTLSVGNWRAGKTRATLVVFVSTQCPFSNAYNTRLKDLAEKYAARGVRTFAINSNKAETLADIAAHAKENKLPYPVLKDAGNAIADRFDAGVTPEAYLIDDTGVLRYRGRIDDSKEISEVQSHDLQIAIDALLAGRAIANPQTRAFGCGIKRVEK